MPRSKKRKKLLKKPPFPDLVASHQDDDDDGEEGSDLGVEDMVEDGEQLMEDDVKFLTGLELRQVVKKQLKRPLAAASEEEEERRKRLKLGEGGADTSDEEAEYERAPRLSAWDPDGKKKGVHFLLPLKASKGRLIQQEPMQLASEDEDSDNSSLDLPSSGVSPAEGEEEERGGGGERTSAPLTEAELFLQCEEKLVAKKESIALIKSMLMENPEGNIGQLKALRALCVERNPDVAVKIRKLAMSSFASVIKDIAPSYHIRELTEAEKAVKVSKDIRKIRHFEETILLDYRLFLSQCDETIKVGFGEQGGKDGQPKKKKTRQKKLAVLLLEDGREISPSKMEGLAELALECMCSLVVSLPHFNFRNNILATLIPLMTSKAREGKVSQTCCSTVERVFQADSVGDVSLEAVKRIAGLVKMKSYKTKPAVLRTFLRLRLHDVDRPVSAAVEAGHRARTKEERKREAKAKLTKKQRRRMKAEAKLEKDLQEASAVESKEKKSKIQTEILKMVFLTYFRILKHSRHSPLLQPVLEGLAKFSHLINVDFFADLMSILHSLAETGGLSNKECMHCVLTAFEILSGQGSALNIDPRQFYIQLYEAILHLDANSGDSDVLLAVECLDKLLRRRRQVSVQRVLGYVKRLSTVAMQLSSAAALAVLATVRKFLQLYSQCEQLLDADAMAGSGVYRPDVPDPEMSCSSSTLLWELADLRFHHEPIVATFAKHLLHGAPSQGKHTLPPDLATKSPAQLASEFSPLCAVAARATSINGIMANVPQPPPHPAMRLAQKNGKYYYKARDFQCADIKELAAEALASADLAATYTQQEQLT